jgi:hypothetical protein
MECFADRIRFFFLRTLVISRHFLFTLIPPGGKGPDAERFQSIADVSVFPVWQHPFWIFNLLFFRISLSLFFYLFAALLSTTHTFFVFHITLQLVSHLLFSPPRG